MKKSGFFAIPLVLSLLIGVQASITLAEERGGGSGSGSGSGAGFQRFDESQVLPPNFLGQGFDGLGQVYVSCKNFGNQMMTSQLANMGNLFSGLGSGGLGGIAGMASSLGSLGMVGMESACPEAQDEGNTSSLSCSAYQTGDRFSPALVKALERRLNQSLMAHMCKKLRLNAVRGEIDCIKKQSDLLVQQMTQLQKAYLDNIQKWQKEVALLKSIIKDRQEQLTEIVGRLKGDGKTGKLGLADLETKLTDVLNKIPTEIEEVRSEHTQAEQQRKALEEQVENRKVALAGSCFKDNVKANYRCSPTGPSVSAYEYILCRYEQNLTLDDSWRASRDERKERMSKALREGLQKKLDEFLNKIPKNPQVPKTPQEAQQAADQAVGVRSLQDILNFAKELDKLPKAKGINVSSFVTKVLVNCYEKSTTTVNRERKLANTMIGVAQFTLKELQKKITVKTNLLFDKYEHAYRESMRVLKEQNIQLPLAQSCRTGEPQFQINCLNKVQKRLKGILTGDADEANTRILIKGNAVPPINIACRGVSGCVTELQKQSGFVEKEISAVTTFKENYIQQANQSVDQFTQQMAQQLNSPSKQITDQLDKLNSVLASLGIGAGINPQPLPDEPLQKDGDGLYMPPKSVINLIGSQVQPPLPNIKGQDLQGTLSAIASKLEELEKKIANTQSILQQIPAFIQGCIAAEFKKLAEQLQQEIDRLSSEGCGTLENHCGHPTAFDNLQGAISEIQGPPGVSDAVRSLNTGLEWACPDKPLGEISDNPLEPTSVYSEYNSIKREVDQYKQQLDALTTGTTESSLSYWQDELDKAQAAWGPGCTKCGSISSPQSGDGCKDGVWTECSGIAARYSTANNKITSLERKRDSLQQKITALEGKQDTLFTRLQERAKLRSQCGGIFNKAIFKANEMKQEMNRMNSEAGGGF